MSLEQAQQFIERMKTDEAFRTKIMAVEEVDGRLNLAKAEGYDCTVEEIKSVSTELSDAELNSVVGAGVLTWGYDPSYHCKSAYGGKCC